MIRFALLLGACMLLPEPRSAEQDPQVAAAPAARSEKAVPESAEPTDAALTRMLELMRAGLYVPKPSTAFPVKMKRETIFDGSYDWHSCVIAHWALLVQARIDDDPQASQWVRTRLAIEDLEHESETLILRPRKLLYTWPYDEAWFVMLLSELGRHPAEGRQDHPRLLKLRELHEDRLLSALEERGFPERQARENAEGETRPARYVGDYTSWLWTYLLLRWSEPVSAQGPARLAALRETKLLPGRATFDAREDAFRPHPYDFLWVPALFALEDPARRSDYSPGKLGPWPAEVSLRDVHVLGRELCRIWPLAGKPAYAERVATLLEREDLWAGDFTVVSHWMPQFLYLGRWFGRQ